MNTTELDRLQYMYIKTTAKIKVYGRQLPPDDKQCKVYGNILPGEGIVVSKNPVNILGQSVYILCVPVAIPERSPFFIRETDMKSKCKIIEEELRNIPAAYVVDRMETITMTDMPAFIAAMDRMQFVTIPKGTKISTQMIYNKYALAEIDGAPIGFVLKSVFGIEIKQDEPIMEESDDMQEPTTPQVSDNSEKTADQGKPIPTSDDPELHLDVEFPIFGTYVNETTFINSYPEVGESKPCVGDKTKIYIDKPTLRAFRWNGSEYQRMDVDSFTLQKYMDDIMMADEIVEDEVLFLDLIICHIDTGRKREKFIQIMNKIQDTDVSYHSMICPRDEAEFDKLQETMKHYNMHSVLDNIPLDYFNNAYILVDGTNTVRLKKKMLSLGLKPIVVR